MFLETKLSMSFADKIGIFILIICKIIPNIIIVIIVFMFFSNQQITYDNKIYLHLRKK